MPTLRNSKHEAFAQQLIHGQKHGWTRGACYSRAGYKAEGKTAEVNASRLLSNANNGVAARVAELAGAGARRAEVTAASVLEKLDRVFDGASAAAQFSAAGRAAEAQARIAGVGAVDRIEIGGPGGFGERTIEQVLQSVARELGAEAATVFAWTLDDRDEPMPVDAIARLALGSATLDEALERNDRMREALLRVASDGAVLVEAVPNDQPQRDTVDRQALATWMEPKPRKGRR